MLTNRLRNQYPMFGGNDKISHVENEILHRKKRVLKKPDGEDYSSKLLSDNGIFFFNTGVDSGSVGEAIQFILEANLDHDCDWEFITMLINSPGGYVTDGFALIDVMNSSLIPIHTVGIGMIASMGLQIFLAGQKGNRTLTTNCMILSHQFAGGSWGKEHELIASKAEFDNISEMVMRHYKRTTGLSEKQIRESLLPASDIWLTAKQALKLGVCDNVKDIKPSHMKAKAKVKKKK